jgi:hypothetical protein
MNKEKRKAYLIEYKKNHKKLYADLMRKYLYKRDYNITIEEYNKIFEKQNGCCAICSRHQSEFKQRLCIDHDHKTGKIRGLLCHNCNRFLGYINDDINNIIEYFNIKIQINGT